MVFGEAHCQVLASYLIYMCNNLGFKGLSPLLALIIYACVNVGSLVTRFMNLAGFVSVMEQVYQKERQHYYIWQKWFGSVGEHRFYLLRPSFLNNSLHPYHFLALKPELRTANSKQRESI